MNLKKAALLRNRAYVGGGWMVGKEGRTYEVKNPFDQSVIERVADLGRADTKLAIEAAYKAFPAWRSRSAGGRAKILKKWYALQLEHSEDLATILTMEQGKPLAEAKGEIKYGASFVEWFAEEGRRTYGDVIPGHSRNVRLLTIKQPIGVVGAITPWNFPNAMITRKVAPALAAGCTVVIKPAEDTPLSALALAALAEEAGFPPGVLNVVTTSDPVPVGEELSSNPLVRKLSFTGSTRVGKLLLRQCADTVKKVSLELGGNAPFIVFEDADIDAAVEGALASKYRNSGQTCICANRFYVQSSVLQSFTQKLTEGVKNQRMGNGMEKGTTIGPLINRDAFQKVDRLVKDATSKGARAVAGGQSQSSDAGNFYPPTILEGVNPSMQIHEEEIFGPVAPIYVFQTEEEVIRLANNTNYGLAAYFYGRDYARIWRVAEALEYGMIGINTGMISTAVAPFGGVKESGIGREGAKYGIEEYLEVKYLCWGGVYS